MNNEGVVRMHRGLTEGEPVWAINHDVIRDSTMTSVVVRDICQTVKVQVCIRYHYISVKQTWYKNCISDLGGKTIHGEKIQSVQR